MLILAIVAILISTLFVAMGGFVGGQADQSVRSSLGVVGNDLATDLRAVDRLAASAGQDGVVEFHARLPPRIGTSQYVIEIADAPGPNHHEITLRTIDPEVLVSVTVRTNFPIAEVDGLQGGTIRIAYDASEGQLVVQHG